MTIVRSPQVGRDPEEIASIEAASFTVNPAAEVGMVIRQRFPDLEPELAKEVRALLASSDYHRFRAAAIARGRWQPDPDLPRRVEADVEAYRALVAEPVPVPTEAQLVDALAGLVGAGSYADLAERFDAHLAAIAAADRYRRQLHDARRRLALAGGHANVANLERLTWSAVVDEAWRERYAAHRARTRQAPTPEPLDRRRRSGSKTVTPPADTVTRDRAEATAAPGAGGPSARKGRHVSG